MGHIHDLADKVSELRGLVLQKDRIIESLREEILRKETHHQRELLLIKNELVTLKQRIEDKIMSHAGE